MRVSGRITRVVPGIGSAPTRVFVTPSDPEAARQIDGSQMTASGEIMISIPDQTDQGDEEQPQ